MPKVVGTARTMKKTRSRRRRKGPRNCRIMMSAHPQICGGEKYRNRSHRLARLLRARSEEGQGLRDRDLQGIWLEGLHNEIRRLRPLAGQQALWIGGHEDHRNG